MLSNRPSALRQRAAALSVLLVVVFQSIASAQTAPRERSSFNADWKFLKDTVAPGPGLAGGGGRGRGAAAPTEPPPTPDKLAYVNIKDWTMSNGEQWNLEEGAAKHARPAGNIGQDNPFTQADFNDSAWRQLSLPHDWGVEADFDPAGVGGTGKLPYYGVGWYRKHLNITAADQGKQIYFDVDGAMAYPSVWLNGQYAGGWGFGWSSFRVDLTPYIKTGDNVLVVRVDMPNQAARWYPGGGMYRNVWLVKTSPIHVGQWGTFVTTPEVSADAAPVNIKVTVDNTSKADASVTVKSQIFAIDINDKRTGAAVATSDTATVQVAAGKSADASSKVTVSKPMLWSTKTPSRYVAVTTIEQAGKVVDTYETTFGIRTLTFDGSKGLLINGQQVHLNGVCGHADIGALGAVASVRGLQRQLEILQTMGCNAIRTSHNPPHPELLDLCDKMGFVVIDELFDAWVGQKTANDYHHLFPDWAEKDTRALIHRDRNHPSVIAWSIGNEIGGSDNPTNANGQPMARRLSAFVRSEDTTRAVTSARDQLNAGFNGYQDIMDMFGYNYLRPANNFDLYKNFHEANPMKMVYSSEAASTISTRGSYAFPAMDQFYNKSVGFTPDGQMSSYDLYAPNWACPPDWEWVAADRAGGAMAGEFVWTGFDYLGEPTRNGGGGGRGRGGAAPADGAAPPQARSSYFGIIDLAGFPKDRYYLYQSRWRPDLAMAHILPNWNWPDRAGQVTPVHVYTSGDEGELFLNGKSLGKRKKAEKGLVELGGGAYKIDNYRLMWDEVVYEPGELKVVTYKAGKEWAIDTMKTTGAASKLTLKPDRAAITADGQDLSFVTVAVADSSGAMVPKSMNQLKFEITGPGEIVAIDNGDPTGMEPFHGTTMKAFNGLCLVIVRAKPGQAGAITLKASSEGLQAADTAITSK